MTRATPHPRAVCRATYLYMRSLDAAGDGQAGSPAKQGSAAKQKELAAAKIQAIQRRNSSTRVKAPAPASLDASLKTAATPGGGGGERCHLDDELCELELALERRAVEAGGESVGLRQLPLEQLGLKTRIGVRRR